MNVLTPVLTLIGVIIGATMHHWFSRVEESEKQLRLLQSQAYVDYLRAVTKSAHAVSSDTKGTAMAEAADAKARLAVYGSSNVIAALAKFEEAGAVLVSPKALEAFVSVVVAMRQNDRAAQAGDLKLVLFGR